MKKVLFTLLAFSFLVTSCNLPEFIKDEQQRTEKPKVCPPSDRNCNGIPDNQE